MLPNASNLTSDGDRGDTGIRDPVLGYSLLCINIFIVTLNTLAIMVIVRFRTKNAVDVFVLTLAMTDLVKGLLPVPVSVYIYLTDYYLKNGSVGCDLFGWTAFTTNSASMLILALMATERFLAVVKPFAYRTWVSPRRVTTVAVIAVFFSAFYSAWPLMGMGRMLTYNGGAYCHFDYSTFSRGTRAYSIFTLVYGFCMIAVVMASYSFVFYKIRGLIHRHRRMSIPQGSQGSQGGTAGQLNLKTEKMFSYLTVVLMLLFWFSWLPFLMVVLASQIEMRKLHKNMHLFAIRVAVVNSMLNPLACAALCKPYRRGIVYYLRVLTSFVGFAAPDSDVFDPWQRGSTGSSCKRQNSQKVVNTHISPEERRRKLTQIFVGEDFHVEKRVPNSEAGDTLIDPSKQSHLASASERRVADVNLDSQSLDSEADASQEDGDNSICLRTSSSADSDDVERNTPSKSHEKKPLLFEKIQSFLNSKSILKHEPTGKYNSIDACSDGRNCHKLVRKISGTNTKFPADRKSADLSDKHDTALHNVHEQVLHNESLELGVVCPAVEVDGHTAGRAGVPPDVSIDTSSSLSRAKFVALPSDRALQNGCLSPSRKDPIDLVPEEDLEYSSAEENEFLSNPTRMGDQFSASVWPAVPARLARPTVGRGGSFDEKTLTRNSPDDHSEDSMDRPRSLSVSGQQAKITTPKDLKDSLTMIDRITRDLLDFSRSSLDSTECARHLVARKSHGNDPHCL